MARGRTATGPAAAIARYAADVHALGDGAHHVASPLGAWLVLALAARAAIDDPRPDQQAVAAVRRALGMTPAEAARVTDELLAAPHPAGAAAAGLWWQDGVAGPALLDYAAGLPAGTTREPLTDQARLDAWAREHSLGLIETFPIRLGPDVLLLLGSALATRVRWLQLFDVVPGAELGAGPFADAVGAALHSVAGHDVRLVRTAAAGLVGAHVAASGDGLAVVSVLGAPDADGKAVLAAAYDVALGLRQGSIGEPVSLFDVSLEEARTIGEVVEDTVVVRGPRRAVERGEAVLPAWRASSELALTRPPTGEAFRAAGLLLQHLLPGLPASVEARQVAVASYTREGFEAAAVTGMAMRASFVTEAAEVPRRTLTLRFGRPYAAVAVAVEPPGTDTEAGGEPARSWFGLPVFGAWVARPTDASADGG